MSSPPAVLDLLSDGSHAGFTIRRALDHPQEAEFDGGELWSLAEKAAGSLVGHFGEGGVVALRLDGTAESLSLLVGGWLSGYTVASLPSRPRWMSSPAYLDSVSSMLDSSGARGLIVPNDEIHEFTVRGGGPLRSRETRTVSYAACTETSTTRSAGSGRSAGGLIQFTSGTTGPPRGVVLSAEAIGANIAAILDRMCLRPGESLYNWLPFSHDMGLIGGALAPWAGAGRSFAGTFDLVLSATERFMRRPSSWLHECSQFGVSHTLAPPSALELCTRLMQRERSWDLRALRSMIVGSEIVRPTVLRAFETSAAPYGFGPKVLTPAYGLAEFALCVTMVPRDSEWAALWLPSEGGSEEFVSAGPPLKGYSVDASLNSSSEPAAVVIDGPSRFRRYSGSLEPEEGPYVSSDVGWRLGSELYVAGRDDDFVTHSGRLVSLLSAEGAVGSQVGQPLATCAVVCDAQSQFHVVVERRRAGSTDLDCEGVRRSVLAAVGVRPVAVHVVPPGWLPRTTSGKVQRWHAQEMLRSALRNESFHA